MHVALISDTAWLDEALDVLRYLVVGLLDEHVGVVQVVPEALPEGECSVFGDRVVWRDSEWGPLRAFRLSRLAARLRELDVSLIHAMDAALWPGCLKLSKALDVPLILGVWSEDQVDQAARLVRSAGSSRIGISVVTERLGKALKQAVGVSVPVQIIPPGVHRPDEDDLPQVCVHEDALCAVISGTGDYDDDYEAVFRALQAIIQEHPQAQFFLDASGNDQHQVWRGAERMGLLANVSVLPRRLGHREMLLRADLIIHPQALGRARVFTLKAMAASIPILAKADPWLDYLIHDETAWLIEQRGPEHWERLLNHVVERPEEARALGRRAREWVGKKHVAARQVALTLALYRRISGESYKFAPATEQAAKAGR